MKFYRSRFFWFFIIAFFIVSLLIYSVYSSSKGNFLQFTDVLEKTNDPSISPTISNSTFTKTTYFVPVTNLKSMVLNVSANDLKAVEVSVLSDEVEQIKSIEGLENIAKVKEFGTYQELFEYINSDKTRLGIVGFDKLDQKLKALDYENSRLLAKGADLTSYKLKLVEEEFSKEVSENQSNFDQTKLKVVGHTGSIIGARGVMLTAQRRFNNDYTKLFESTKPLFDSMDYVSATLEAPFEGTGKYCDRCLTFVGDDRLVNGIKYSGIDMVSLGANHIMNGGVSALKNSQTKLTEAGILHTGASTINNDDAGKPVLADVNGLKIAYLGFVDSPGRSEWAQKNSPGAANISDWEIDVNGNTTKYEPNEERIKYFFQRAKDLKPDLIFVIMHWGGQEYKQVPTAYTKKLASLMVKHGADAILGDHPHWVQEMEFMENKPVFYCVGNYVFDQTWSEETKQGLSAEMSIYNGKIVNLRFYPHYVQTQGVPELIPPTSAKYSQILNRMWDVTKVK